jgi:hypothetical protein
MSFINNITHWLDQKATPISAYGLIFLLGLTAFFGLDKLISVNKAALASLNASQQELALLSAIDGQDIWSARKNESADLKSAFDAQLWQGETAGAIAARLQQDLRRKAGGLEMKNIRVIVDPQPSEAGALSVLNFELSGLLPPHKTLHDSLAVLAGDKYSLTVNQASLTFATRRPSLLRLSGIAPITMPRREA